MEIDRYGEKECPVFCFCVFYQKGSCFLGRKKENLKSSSKIVLYCKLEKRQKKKPVGQVTMARSK